MLPQHTKRRRCIVLTDGTAIGCYQRKVHETHIVVLEPSGHTYTYIQPNGTRTRHLTPTALSNHRPLVIDTLNLRNRFTTKPPYLHARMMDTKDVRYQRRIRTPRARWPINEGKVKVSLLFNNKEESFEMQSIEGAAKVQLHASGKLVELYYVVEVKVSDDDVEENSSYAHYATLHQSFAVAQTPESFKFPVNFLLAVKAAWDDNQEAEIEYARYKKENDSSVRVSPLPRNGAFDARPAFSVIATNSQPSGDDENYLMLAEVLRIATLPSKMLYRRVVAEALEEDTMLFVSRRPSICLPEIVMQVDRKHSLLTGCDGFFTWYGKAGRLQHRFTRETIPPSSTMDTKRAIVFCQHIDYVLLAFRYAPRTLDHDTLPSTSLLPDELELVEEVENELGRFRAFRGGRIRVAFADRTILQVEHDGECCSFFFSDGSAHRTTLASAPLRHRVYIYEALEFGDWAFSSQEQRMKRHAKRQEAQAIVVQELQRISVRCRMNSDLRTFQNCSEEATQKMEAHSSESKDPSLALSLAAARKLQDTTLQHIASVNQAIQAAAFMTANNT